VSWEPTRVQILALRAILANGGRVAHKGERGGIWAGAQRVKAVTFSAFVERGVLMPTSAAGDDFTFTPAGRALAKRLP